MAHMRRTPQEIWRLDASKFAILVLLIIAFLIFSCVGSNGGEMAEDEAGNSLITGTDVTVPALVAPDVGTAIEAGEVTFEGSGAPDTSMQLLLDDEPLDTVDVDGSGSWSYTTDLEQGQYDLRLQALDVDGHVTVESDPLALNIGMDADAESDDNQGAGETTAIEPEVGVVEGDSEDVSEGDEESVEPQVTIVNTPAPTPAATPASDEETVEGSAGTEASEAEASEGTEVVPEPLTLDVSGFDDTSAPGLRTPKGTGPANSQVEILVDNEVSRSTTVSEDGQWSSIIMFSEPGKYLLAARALDESGEVIDQTQQEVVRIAAPTPMPVVEMVAPSFDENSLSVENLQMGNVTLSGVGEPDSSLELTIDENSAGTTIADSDGNWSLDATFEESGKYLLGLNSLDESGNVLASASPKLITIPTPEPTETPEPTAMPEPTATLVPAAFAFPDEWATGAITLTGSGAPSSTLELLVDNNGVGTTTVDAEGAWAINTSFDDPGKYVLGLNTLDADGNILDASDQTFITIPTPAPTVVPTPAPTPAPPTFELPENLAAGDLTLTGTGIPSSTMELLIDSSSAGTTTVDTEGMWSLDTAFPDAGKYLVGLNSLDADGNLLSASKPTLINIPTPEPEPTAEVIPAAPLVIDQDLQGERAPGLAVLQGSGEPGTELEVTVDDVAIGRTVVNEEGAWSLPTRFNSKGVYFVRSSVVGDDGTSVETSEPVVIVIPEATAVPTAVPTPVATLVPATFLARLWNC